MSEALGVRRATKARHNAMVDLVRATSGIAIDEYGLALGEVSLDERLSGMLDGTARFKPLPTPPAMEHELYTFQEAGHGWLRLLGDLGLTVVQAPPDTIAPQLADHYLALKKAGRL